MDQGENQASLFNKVIPLSIEDEIKNSYLDYAMSVIVGRALPDARDGLKPVQRRILYSMMELGLRHNHGYRKSATVVGEVMGKYHPHGDAAIYETMVRMAQDFNMRYEFVDGQGNFGSHDGNPPAAMRYTEARLQAFGEEMLKDIDEDTVDWGPNYDERLQEPLLLPSGVPNLLVNGSSGIAVGMATNMPPHNLGEVVNACCACLDDPQIELGELMAHIPGPDFPTGGMILGRDGILEAYRTGRGKVTMRGKTEVEEGKRGRKSIVIKEVPYMINLASLMENIAKGVNSGLLDGITNMRDESDRNGLRIVLELHRDADPSLVLRQLYNRTQLQATFGVINLALVDGRPREMGLRELIDVFLHHRRTVIRRRTEFRLRKAEERAHIVEGLIRALDLIDEVVHIIRTSRDVSAARDALIQQLGFSEVQAQAILDMRLARLTGLERDKLQQELEQLISDIERYRMILGDPAVLDALVKDELREIKKVFNDSRRTEIQDSAEDVMAEDLIPETEIVVVLSRDGYIRRMPLQDYHTQSRGGKGVKGATPKAEDEIALMRVTTTHRTLYLFTSKGRVFGIRAHILPEPKTGKGKQIGTFISMEQGETVVAVRDSDFGEGQFILFVTRMGIAKRMPLQELEGLTRAGRRILTLGEDDIIARIRVTHGEDELLFTTARGQSLRVLETEFRPLGRAAQGVRGIRLEGGDYVVGCDAVTEGSQLLFVSEQGIGKRTPYGEFTLHHRGGLGVRAMKLGERTGLLVGAWGVAEDDEMIVISGRGRVIRLHASDISSLSRTATGYTVVKLDDNDMVADVSIVRGGEKPEEE